MAETRQLQHSSSNWHNVTIYFSFVFPNPHPVFVSPHKSSHHPVDTLSPLSLYHLANPSPPHHHITLSPHHLVTTSPCHLVTLSPLHLYHPNTTSLSTKTPYCPITLNVLVLSLSCPCPCPVLVLSLSLSCPCPCLDLDLSHLCIPLSIPFLGHCICPSLVPIL